jgi:CBS-domain-containing membrane protein
LRWPFATSIVLVLGTPDAGPAQPRALVGGHLVSTRVGLPVGALLLAAFACAWHNLIGRRSRNPVAWPAPWW